MRLHISSAALILMLTGCMRTGNLRPYAGQWLLMEQEKPFAVLTMRVHRGRLVGTLQEPEHVRELGDGSGTAEFSDIAPPIVIKPVRSANRKDPLAVRIGPAGNADPARVRMSGADQLLLPVFPEQYVPPWQFKRVPMTPRWTVATRWAEYSDDPKVAAIQSRLDALVLADQDARARNPISDAEVQRLADEARPFVEDVFHRYGWPKRSVFGAKAANEFWLLVQHQDDEVQARMLSALNAAVQAGEASRRNYAFTFDRVQVAANKLQHWGTQAHCNEDGTAVAYPSDDAQHLDARRAELKLGPARDDLRELQSLCARADPDRRR